MVMKYILTLILGIAFIGFTNLQSHAQRRGGGSRFSEYMDRNKDGFLDAEETSRIPSRLRDYLVSKKIDLSKGISREKFDKITSDIFSERRMMYQRSEGSESSRGDDSGSGRRRYYGSRVYTPTNSYKSENSKANESGSQKGKSKSSSNKEAKRVRVTADLPDKFTTIDQDKDGQVGFYEWRTANPEQIADFQQYDHNSDGFLTPKELIRGKLDLLNSAISKSPVPPRPSVVSQQTPKPSSKSPATDNLNEDNPLVKKGRHYFGLMDRNGDKTLSIKEWQRSRRLRPVFERDGIDLEKPMDRDTFVSNYVRLFPGG